MHACIAKIHKTHSHRHTYIHTYIFNHIQSHTHTYTHVTHTSTYNCIDTYSKIQSSFDILSPIRSNTSPPSLSALTLIGKYPPHGRDRLHYGSARIPPRGRRLDSLHCIRPYLRQRRSGEAALCPGDPLRRSLEDCHPIMLFPLCHPCNLLSPSHPTNPLPNPSPSTGPYNLLSLILLSADCNTNPQKLVFHPPSLPLFL